MYEAPGTGAGKAHLLDDIVDNITLMPDFYKRKTLTYMLRDNEALCKLFREKAVCEKRVLTDETVGVNNDISEVTSEATDRSHVVWQIGSD